MIRRAQLHLLTPLALACGSLLVSAPAHAATANVAPGLSASDPAGSGGSGLSGAPGSGGVIATPAELPVSATGNGITVQTLESGLLRGRLTFTGTVPAADGGDTVEIERSTDPARGQWLPTAHATVASGGAFSVVWRANRAGRFAIEAELLVPSATAASASRVSRSAAPAGSGAAGLSVTPASSVAGPVSPAVTIVVYRPSLATIYGPGFYGRQTACGQTLQRSTIGVASRTLKCGTKVSILYGGRALVVPVIDRGPYANGATWDLTMATARALAIPGTSTIGALPTL